MTIESIAAGGDGVARADGLVVFVPRTAPGDVARIAFQPHGRFARGTLVALVRPSDRRVTPPCPHYERDRCGGCQLQHLRYDAQLDAKGGIVHDALRRIGRRDVGRPVVEASPSPWRYRRKLTLAVRRRGDRWVGGLHPYDAPGRVFAVDDCPITQARVMDVWRAVLDAGALLPDAAELRAAVRVDDDAATFVVEGGGRWTGADALLERVPALQAIWWTPAGGQPMLAAAREGGAAPGASFTQVNPAVAAAMHRHVVGIITRHDPRVVIDAYAGTGDTAAVVASDRVRVTAIELDPAAAAWCASRLPTGSRAIAGRVEDVLPDVLPADVVVLNPPRAGVDARVTRALHAAPRARCIVYVSCDPATLGRDVARLDGWRIASLAAFDMFPQTAHVECVCELVPEDA